MSKRMQEIVKAMLSRRWLPATIIVIAGMVLMVRLGLWQLDRLDERRAENTALLAILESGTFQMAEEPLPDDLEMARDRQAVARGTFDVTEQVILLVQNWSGSPGVHLITPLVLADGQTAVLVDRGWVPQQAFDDDVLAQYDPAPAAEVKGFITLSQPPPRYGNAEAEPDGPQREVYRVDVVQLQAQLPYDLLPVYLRQAPDDDQTVPPLRRELEIDLSEGPHLSYALQWFMFTIIIGIGYFLLVNRSLKREADAPAVADPDLPPPPPEVT